MECSPSHYWETLLLGDKLFLAPIGDSPQVRRFRNNQRLTLQSYPKSLQNVLDVGTGTGIWAM